METRQLGQSDIQITPIIMGLWQAGKEMWVDIDDKQTTQAVRAAFDSGITTFDTAEAYGKGHSEKILASATSDIRHKAIYATKVFTNWPWAGSLLIPAYVPLQAPAMPISR